MEILQLLPMGGAIGDLLRNLLLDHKLVYKINENGKGPYLDISECSLTVIRKEDGKYKLIEFADVGHLSGYFSS